MEIIKPIPDDYLDRTDLDQDRVFIDFLRIAMPILLLLLLIFITVHFFHYSVTSSILNVRERSHIEIGLEAIRSDVQAATSDLMYLVESFHMQELLRSDSIENRSKIANEFSSVLKAKKHYDQIRYLDETGMEVVRVNYNSGAPLSIPKDKLQNKGGRYYFTDTITLDRQIVFVSPMDLNIENGQIETPLKPMLRFGTPVFDDIGRKRGIVLINYYADTIRRKITQYLANTNSMPMLLNAQGHWLLAPDKKDEWGFMYKNQRRFDRRYPEVWKKIIQEQTGQVKTAHGVFTFLTIHPLQKEHTSSSGSAKAFAKSSTKVDDKRYFWVLLTHIPQTRLMTEIKNHIKQGVLQFCLVCTIVMPLVWLFSRERFHRKWAWRELRKKEQYLSTITSQLAEGLLVIDRQKKVITMNKEAELLLGWKSEELIGNCLKTVLAESPRNMGNTDQECAVTKAINQSVSQRLENIAFITKQGKSIPVSLSIAPYRYEADVLGVIITFRDISERLQMQAELKIMATHDPLTGVKNRGEIERLLNLEFDRAHRYQRPLSLLMIDIDHFKKINDTYGHQNGDTVLRIACEKIVAQLRNNDVLGRYGGEEFIVILPETSLSPAESIAERLSQCLAELTVAIDAQTKIQFTVSIGVASYPKSAHNIENLIKIADERLYQAKEDGRNRVIANTRSKSPISIVASPS